MIYGYARVSSTDQNLDRQLLSLTEQGVLSKHIFCDKASGKDFNRTNFLKLKKKLKHGDLLLIHSIDRLGRNYDMIIEEWGYITKTIGADIRVLDMPLLDTSANKESLTGKLIADIVLQLLSYVAQKERENIKKRQREGIDAAKLRGVKFGRPRIVLATNRTGIFEDFFAKKITASEAAKRLKISVPTFYRRVKSFN